MKNKIIFISFLLLTILLFRSCYDIGIASKKNDDLLFFLKQDIDKMHDIDSVKMEAKRNLDIIKTSRHDHSNFAKQMFWLIMLLFIIQIMFWKAENKTSE